MRYFWHLGASLVGYTDSVNIPAPALSAPVPHWRAFGNVPASACGHCCELCGTASSSTVYGVYGYFCLSTCLIALCAVSVSDCTISLWASTVRRGVAAHLSLGVMDRCVGVQLEHRQVVLIGPAGETHSVPAGLVQRQ